MRAGVCRWLVVFAALGMNGVRVVRAQAPLIPPAFYAVQGAPFEATIDSVWNGNGQTPVGRSLSRIYRDSEGRQRFEVPALEEAGATGQRPMVTVYDPVRERVIKLDVQNRVATVTPMQRVGRTVKIDLGARKGFPCRAAPGGESLGVRWLTGLETCGLRLPGRTLWLSTSYLMPLMEVRTDKRLGDLTQTVLQLDAGEPDKSLFEVPAGYRVAEPDTKAGTVAQ